MVHNEVVGADDVVAAENDGFVRWEQTEHTDPRDLLFVWGTGVESRNDEVEASSTSSKGMGRGALCDGGQSRSK